MWIPSQYHGKWSGTVKDAGRRNGYQGEIEISADAIETKYVTAQKLILIGKLTGLSQSDNCLLFVEETKWGKVTLLLYLDLNNNLKCVWRRGKKCDSEATMKLV